MPLESSTTIDGLDDNWPLGGDPSSRGDDHIRLIKAVLKAQFPGENGDGFDTPILATETEINSLSGISGNIQDQIDGLTLASNNLGETLSAPSGTRMVFYQAAAPAGWTQLNTLNDYMMRVVSGTGGGSGGTDSPINKSFTHSHSTGNFTLQLQHIPSHSHTIKMRFRNLSINDIGSYVIDDNPANNGSNLSTEAQGGGQPHNHGNTGSATLNFTPKYVNMIICEKD